MLMDEEAAHSFPVPGAHVQGLQLCFPWSMFIHSFIRSPHTDQSTGGRPAGCVGGGGRTSKLNFCPQTDPQYNVTVKHLPKNKNFCS